MVTDVVGTIKDIENLFDFQNEKIRIGGGLLPTFMEAMNCDKVLIRLLKGYIPSRSKRYTPYRNYRILDAGCGVCFHSVLLSHLYPQAEIDAIDVSSRVVGRAREINRYFHGRVDIRAQDLRDVKEDYDLILCNLVMEYFNDEEKPIVLGNLLRHCSTLIFSIPLFASKGIIDNGAYFCSLKEWKGIIKKAGGRIIETNGIRYPFKFMNIFEYNLSLNNISLSRIFHPLARIIIFVCNLDIENIKS